MCVNASTMCDCVRLCVCASLRASSALQSSFARPAVAPHALDRAQVLHAPCSASFPARLQVRGSPPSLNRPVAGQATASGGGGDEAAAAAAAAAAARAEKRTAKKASKKSKKKSSRDSSGRARIKTVDLKPVDVVRALHPFQATDESELTIAAGDKLVIYRKDDSGWWYAKNEAGEEGFVPHNYVESTGEQPTAEAF
jgi:hypothetical protein